MFQIYGYCLVFDHVLFHNKKVSDRPDRTGYAVQPYLNVINVALVAEHAGNITFLHRQFLINFKF